MLIHGRYESEYAAAVAVARWLQRVFVYVPDPARGDGKPADRWPSRLEVEGKVAKGTLRGDCDDGAFAAVYALADLGYKARVIMGWTEPVYDAEDQKTLPRYHMLCETEQGYLVDIRFPGQVQTWNQQPQFVRDKMSGLFEFGQVAQWFFVKNEEAPPPLG